MFLKEAPINTAVLQDSHGDVKMFLDRKVKTVKKNKKQNTPCNSPDSESLGVITSAGLRLIPCCSPWCLKTLDIPKLFTAITLHRKVSVRHFWRSSTPGCTFATLLLEFAPAQ